MRWWICPTTSSLRDAACSIAIEVVQSLVYLPSSHLIVITGPIGSGKSALSQAAATELRANGYLTAVIDLDLVWFMVRSAPNAKLPIHGWPLARQATASLAGTFFDAGLEVVIVEGPFGTKRERESFCSHLAENIRPRFITLRVSLDEAWRRVQLTPTANFRATLNFWPAPTPSGRFCSASSSRRT